MSETTLIPWAHSTVNDWSGCSKLSAGCANCYAEVRDRRMMQERVIHWGHGAPRLKSKSAAAMRARLNKKPWICDACGNSMMGHPELYCTRIVDHCGTPCGSYSFHRRRIFSLSLGDWLDPEVPIEWLAGMLDSIRLADQCTHILCTKRPELWHDRVSSVAINMPTENGTHWIDSWVWGSAPQNIWLLTSVENQEAADKRIPKLLNIPAAVHGISAEPLLGPVDLKLTWAQPHERLGQNNTNHQVNWVIAGGESGPKARPCAVEWLRSIKDQCQAAQVPCFVKQDSGPKAGMQGRIPDDIFNVKEFPNARPD